MCPHRRTFHDGNSLLEAYLRRRPYPSFPETPTQQMEKHMRKKFAIILAAVLLGLAALTGCSDDSDVASKNLSKAADNFQVERQIVFYNGITGDYIAEVNGLCSVETSGAKLYVVCKTGPGEYIKNFLGLSDNVTWFALQTSPKKVSTARYKIVFKPSTVIPDFDYR